MNRRSLLAGLAAAPIAPAAIAMQERPSKWVIRYQTYTEPPVVLAEQSVPVNGVQCPIREPLFINGDLFILCGGEVTMDEPHVYKQWCKLVEEAQ